MVKLLSHLHLNYVTLDASKCKIIEISKVDELISLIDEYIKRDPENYAVTIESLYTNEIKFAPADVKYRIRPGEP